MKSDTESRPIHQNSSKTLVIRADAGADIGIGHVMRCLALAQTWQEAGGKAVFIMAKGGAHVGGRLQSEGIETVEICAKPGGNDDAECVRRFCRESRVAWLVVDGFHFSTEYLQNVRSGPDHLLVMDDHGRQTSYQCDVVLNTNPYADDDMYPLRDWRARFLLGPGFALLRREFLAGHRQTSEPPDVARKVLVTLGGSDPHNVTAAVIGALQSITGFELESTIVIGSTNPRRSELEDLIRSSRGSRALVDPDSMPELMASAELAVSAGGGTCYELAFARVPMLLITMADNHERTVKSWAERRAAVDAGWFHELDREGLAAKLRDAISDKALRRDLAENAARIVDGMGAKRVVQIMLGRSFESN